MQTENWVAGSHGKAAGTFQTTHWSVVLSAGHSDSPLAHEALAEFCRLYWYPLYVYVRRKGYDPATAKDLTQEFFAQLLEKRWLAGLEASGGKFRSWLLGVMNHFLAHEWAKARAQKRGGGQQMFSLDDEAAEERYQHEPVERCTPETLFDRRWALTLLEQAASRLRQEYEESEKGELYAAIKGFVSVEGSDVSYEQAAVQLKLSPNAVRVAVHRLRRRYQELICAEIARTVGNRLKWTKSFPTCWQLSGAHKGNRNFVHELGSYCWVLGGSAQVMAHAFERDMFRVRGTTGW
jgi:RNA polymerase sigma-70 factor (ECF subfamily)